MSLNWKRQPIIYELLYLMDCRHVRHTMHAFSYIYASTVLMDHELVLRKFNLYNTYINKYSVQKRDVLFSTCTTTVSNFYVNDDKE